MENAVRQTFLRVTGSSQLLQYVTFRCAVEQPVFVLDTLPAFAVFAPESLVRRQPFMRGFVGFGLVGGVIDHEQVVKVVGESAALRACPDGCAMPVRMRQRHDMVDIDIGSLGQCLSGIRADPQSGFDRALPGILELNGYPAGRDEQFLAGVAAVLIGIDPVRPVLALVGRIGYRHAFGLLRQRLPDGFGPLLAAREC